ncbi:hypothetical protein [Tumebacillus flagellatus]|uniref:DUF429 domain-containing protein n=1 Tax=Tumebacillus flagellatus TaxID=1157490 RepID=A0A074LQI2_9BACL|nr:hypothetical protein [Tumebacillus flagellatus]KEO82750.1 hypothetical protein EL26_13450 [Tumebacillus flagellatus]
MFDWYAFADYSGAKTLAGQRKHIVLAKGDGRDVTLVHHTRASLFGAWKGLLQGAGEKRILLGVDHSYSFPLGFYEAVTGETQRSWDDLLALLKSAASCLSEWNPRDWAAQANAVIAARTGHSTGPFWGAHFRAQVKKPNFPHAELRLPERRLVETRNRSLKPIYQLGGNGAVGLQSLFGMPYLAHLRRFCREQGILLHAWPFDGWEIPAHGHVLVEVYPTLYNRGQRTDENDAEACVTALAELDQRDELLPLFHPKLNDEERKRAGMEGWVLGVD